MKNPWKTIKQNKIYQGKYGHCVRVDEVITPANKKGEYIVFECKDSATIVALTKDNQVVMERLWRYPIEDEILELPVGGIEKNEDPLSGAKRELFEETGAKSNKWINLGWHWTDTGFSNTKGNIFLALEVEIEKSQNPDENEKIEVELVDFDQVLNKVLNNEITDGVTKMGILLTDKYLRKER